MGKKKYIESPEEMWQMFEAYKKYVKDNPRIRYVFVGKDGDQKEEKLEVPLTMEGFSTYVAGIAMLYGRTPKRLNNYFANTDGLYDDYLTICSRIREEIRKDQIEGGMVGQYNASITQRLNGLVDKRETDYTTKGKPIFGTNPLNE